MSILPAFLNRTETLRPLFEDPDVTEICINGPGILWAARQGERYMKRVDAPALSQGTLEDLADLVAHYSDQDSDAERPLLGASIPAELTGQADNDYRVQFVRPPVVRPGTVAVAIRKPSPLDLEMDDYVKSGAFDRINEPLPDSVDQNKRLSTLYRDRNWPEFFSLAVRMKKNIIVSAATNTGKTEFIKMLLKSCDPRERIVTIQDAFELRLRQQNVVHLIYSRGNQGTAKVTPVDLMETSLRLSGDRVIPGELRGAEAFAALEMLNSGHGGFLTTIHATSPNDMFDRLAQMVMRFGSTMQKAEIIDYARGLIDVVIQMHRYDDGLRGVRNVLYVQR